VNFGQKKALEEAGLTEGNGLARGSGKDHGHKKDAGGTGPFRQVRVPACDGGP